jgi:hypothetical protein
VQEAPAEVPPPLSGPETGSLVVRSWTVAPRVRSVVGLPTTLPDARELGGELGAECEWHWFPEVRGAVLVPRGWRPWSGWGETLGVRTFTGAVVPEGWSQGTPPRMPVGLLVSAYFGAPERKDVWDTTPKALGEWFMSLAMRRASQPLGPEQVDADADLPPRASASVMEKIDIVDSWAHELVPGVHAFGLEYVVPFDDTGLGGPILAQGFQYHSNVVVHLHEANVYEVTFKAPAAAWPAAWRAHGHLLTDHCYLNWDDASPEKYL